MKLDEITVGKTYVGHRDYKRGHSTHRTVIEHDQECSIVLFRNEVGDNPPDCYVKMATMAANDFAAWAEREVPTPASS